MCAETGIPALIHQTWKDTDVPPKWSVWVQSWRRHHPGWEYWLWTDADNRAFLEKHYPWFLPIYDGYPQTIMRADAIRYFLLDHFGGLYVDLDFECLRPVSEILDGRGLVLGCEPEVHARLLLARQRGFGRIIGNAFIASRPAHPFWTHVHRELVRAHKLSSALDATGPFFLTRAIDTAQDSGSITVLDAELLYPKVNGDAEQLFGPRVVDHDRAYAVHHWSGSWTEKARAAPQNSEEQKVTFRLSQRLEPLAYGLLDVDAQRRRWDSGASAPLVSCLMVTRERPALAKRAIACFRAQTYRNAELVVVDDDTSDALEHYVCVLDDPSIRFHRLPSNGLSLGALRNIAVEQARGPYVCQWDDDDLYDPERLEVEMAAIVALGAEMCFLARERLWWPAGRKLALSSARVWEGSMVCARDKLPRYPSQRRGEDTPVVNEVVRLGRVVAIDAPDLYTYVFHGNNTFDAAHFAQHFDVATEMWSGAAYTEQVRSMANRLPIDPEEFVGFETGTRPAENSEV